MKILHEYARVEDINISKKILKVLAIKLSKNYKLQLSYVNL